MSLLLGEGELEIKNQGRFDQRLKVFFAGNSKDEVGLTRQGLADGDRSFQES